MTQPLFSGRARVAVCQRLGDSWRNLALCLEIPPDEQDRFDKGDEGRQILQWLEQHNRLGELPEALSCIGRDELALILQPPPLPAAATIDWSGSPYPGLRPFSAEDAPVFFGRHRDTAELVTRLNDPGQRFIAVVGASGSGKSSLVGAGLLPALRQNAPAKGKDWRVLEFTPGGPGGDPFPPLAFKLEPLLKPCGWVARDIDRKLRASGGLPELAGLALAPGAPAELLLFIDQFEELFTLCQPEHQAPFINMLDQAARAPSIRIILTLRSDFTSHGLQYPKFAELLKTGFFPLPPPGVAELYEMITRPAALARLRFEDEALPFRILEDTGAAPGGLPLMACALAELYDRREPEGLLTHAAYHGFGGVKGVISKRANETYRNLDGEAQAALASVFRELVEVDPEQGVPTRKRARHSDFGDSPEALRLIDAFTQARLLVCHENVVEVAHEALLTHWDRVSEWIGKRFDDLRLLRRVQLEAAEWRKRRGYLWPHERLAAVYRMRENLKPRLSRVEQAFIRPESDRLLKKIRNPALTHQERVKIGDRLAEIGDPRPGVGLKDGLPDIVWLPVPGGEIGLEGVKGAFAVEPFHISRYPITYGQYRCFLEAEDGYRNKRWWEGLAEREDWPGEQHWKLDNHPAENVSWYDAMAFCRWLSDRLATTIHQQFGPGRVIRLPTEWEWQQAATGGAPANVYPWGHHWEGSRVNTWESGLSRTTAVGLYPQGASPVGALDMSGNVWEWCLNSYDDPRRISLADKDSRRVVRGGSWLDLQVLARAPARYHARAGDRNSGGGLRVVCAAPIF